MIYRIRHVTSLSYGGTASGARINLRLRPVDWPGQRVIRQSLTIAPRPAERQDSAGPYVVNLTAVSFTGGLSELTVTSTMEIEVTPPPVPATTPSVQAVRDTALAVNDLSAWSPAPYLYASRVAVADPGIAEWAAAFLGPDRPVLDAARALASAIHAGFAYDAEATDSMTSPAEAFAARSGVCQDFTHVMIVALRGHGIPAAYVSGYLRTDPPPGMERLVGTDAMHAWATVWCGPELGWIGIDPTNDCLARENHVAIAMGRDFADVSPIDGVFTGSAVQTMDYAVDVVALA